MIQENTNLSHKIWYKNIDISPDNLDVATHHMINTATWTLASIAMWGVYVIIGLTAYLL